MRTTLCLLLAAVAASCAEAPRVFKVLDVSKVWAGHPVGFDLLTAGGRQFVAFYDDQRRMTVASRRLSEGNWRFARLPSQLGWDSHNYVVMAADQEGFLHLSGNMHVRPLVYFRTSKPWDIDSFEAIHKMTGGDEARCTYPKFLRGVRNELIFTYRDGRSGSGNQIYNVYDVPSRAWKRLLDRPLTDGQGRMNAYFHGPERGPDGFFHLLWVWRDTPDCSTNHDLSYARSKDLVHWETSAGKPLSLPIRLETGEIVDPVAVKGGIINGAAKIGWDSANRPVITYHKFDERGYTQVYHARLENGRWKIYRTSDWEYRWEFQGGGAIEFEIRLGAVRRGRKGELLLNYNHVKYGAGVWRLDERSLKPVGKLPVERAWPPELEKPESSFPGIQVHLTQDRGGPNNVIYLLRWETLGPNRDRPRQGPVPEPGMLRLYEITRSRGS